jgi:hypothetical protein
MLACDGSKRRGKIAEERGLDREGDKRETCEDGKGDGKSYERGLERASQGLFSGQGFSCRQCFVVSSTNKH